MEVLDEHLQRRREIHNLYSRAFAGSRVVTVIENPSPEFDSNFWLTTVLFDESVNPDDVRVALAGQNIETRLLWRPMHMMPVYADAPFYGNGVSERLFGRGLCLPSGSSLTDSDIARVIKAIEDAVATR